MTRNTGPNRQQPEPMPLDSTRTARVVSVPIIMTGTILEKTTPEGKAAAGLGRREAEPFLFPDGFDKFCDAEFRGFFENHPVKTIVMVGSSTHICIMYTATAAARQYAYDVVIPVDGVNTANE